MLANNLKERDMKDRVVRVTGYLSASRQIIASTLKGMPETEGHSRHITEG
jgi:hypothetical protein